MTRRAAIVILLGLLATAAGAQSVPVRSADHDGFSRIVLHMPGRAEWRLESDARARILRFGREGLHFDISAVYDRMTNARVASVTPLTAPPGLRFGLTCDCDVSATWQGASMLVIDIRDPAPGPQARQAPPPFRLPFVPHAAVALTAPGLMPTLSQGPEAAEGPASAPRVGSDSAGQAILASAREVLAQQIARAAGLGLLTAQDTIKAVPAEPVSQTDRQPAIEEPGLAIGGAPGSHLAAENSMDLVASEAAGRPAVNSEGAICLPDHAIDLPAWGEAQAFALQIGPLRKRLMEEFDRVEPEVARDLARLYLYFGFGAEARQVLDLHEAATDEDAILRALAFILDDRPAGTVLMGQTDCDSDAALWSALSYEVLAPDLPLDVDAMLRALNRLPPHLRGIVAPQLARKLLRAGHEAAADRVLRILDRAPAPATPVQTLLQVEAMPAETAPEVADAALGKVIEADDGSAAEALIRRIDRRLGLGRGVPREMAELAGAFAQEHRDTPIGHDLARSYLEAAAAAGDFALAFREFARLSPHLPADMQDTVLSTILGLMAEAADDLTFITHALRLRDAAPERIAPDVADGLARRLVDLGFPSEAAAYLRARASGSDMQERQVLRARIALAQGQPQQAQVELLGLTGKDVNLLRAEAHGMAGKHRAAHFLYLAGGEAEKAAAEAVLAGDWEQLAATADPAMAQMARLVAIDDTLDPRAQPEQGVLAADQALLEDASAARDIITQLLASRQMPPTTD